MKLKEKYAPRQIKLLEIFEKSDWQLKTYSILYRDKDLDKDLVRAAQNLAIKTLPQPAQTQNRYGLGFINVHQGQSYDFVSIAYWAYETELKIQNYIRGSSTSYELEKIAPEEISIDIWDIKLISFESSAWVEHILKADKPEPQSYLAARLNELI